MMKVNIQTFKIRANRELVLSRLNQQKSRTIKNKKGKKVVYVAVKHKNDTLKNQKIRVGKPGKGLLHYAPHALAQFAKDTERVKGYTVLRFHSKKTADIFVRDYKQNVEDSNARFIEKGLFKPGEKENHIFKLNAAKTKHIKKYNTTQLDFTVDIRNDMNPDDFEVLIEKIYDDVRSKYVLDPKDKLRFVYYGLDGLAVGGTKLTYINDFEPHDVKMKVGNESGNGFSCGVSYEDVIIQINSIGVTIVKNTLVAGSAPSIKDKFVSNKRSILQIKNEDDLCLGRCLVCAIAKRDEHPKCAQIRKGRKIQTTLTHELYDKAGIERETATLDTIVAFEQHLDCSITVIDSDNFNSVIYPDPSDEDYEPKEFNVYVYKRKNHYDLINTNKVAGFFGKRLFCSNCKKTYTHKSKHKCSFKCPICCSHDCDCIGIDYKDHGSLGGTWHGCDNCDRNFPSEKCFANHQIKNDCNESTCDRIWKCPHRECRRNFDRKRFPKEEHTHGEFWCNNCAKKVQKDHKCYMMPTPIKEPSEKYIYFDFEATQNTGKHVVNLSVSQYHDNPEPIIHHNLDEFCQWLFRKEHTNYTVIAHNAKGYDNQFIMKYIYNQTSYKPFVVYAGSKIMTMSIKTKGMNIRFIDSLNFLTMPLAAFPGTFGIEELKKGYYPHTFNTETNKDYVGPMPPRNDFAPYNMKHDDCKKFKAWYKDKVDSNYVWDNAKELLEYCISDVDILRRCMIQFRQLYLDIAKIDPLQYTTIASVCMAIFKGHFLVKNYNTDYWAVRNGGDKAELEEFKIRIRNQVFEEGKIGMFNFEDEQFIRKSFFGGRTNATCLLYQFKDGEVGHYRDITSLYPTVNYYDTYGLGHLVTEKFNFGDYNKMLDKYGWVDCEVWCPNDLYLPVLPHKNENTKKLTFDLNDKRGVWSTMELKKAVEQGYNIRKVHQFKYYERTSNTLFRDYVETFLKIKQESSGKPDWVKNDADLHKYVEGYEKHQGIRMDITKIKKNKGLRALAKLCLNNLWGRFGMRANMPTTEITSDVAKFNNIIFNEKYTNQHFFFIDDERVELKYKMQEDCVKMNPSSNIGIAAFTTSHARLRLYQGMEKVGDQILYNDTDSLIYKYDKTNPNHQEIQCGDYLGDWTDELEGPSMIGTFVSGGPKNKSYETDDGIIHTSIKGFNLNYSNMMTLNHFSMIDLVLNRGLRTEDNHKTVGVFNIKRLKDKSLKSEIITKRYNFGYDKRHICDPDDNGNIFTLPHGHRDIK